jgi:hypothetical protein
MNWKFPHSQGIFRWKVSKVDSGEITAAPPTEAKMDFAVGASQQLTNGMVRAAGETRPTLRRG